MTLGNARSGGFHEQVHVKPVAFLDRITDRLQLMYDLSERRIERNRAGTLRTHARAFASNVSSGAKEPKQGVENMIATMAMVVVLLGASAYDAPATGIGPIYSGFTNRDIATGQNLYQSDYQRGQMMSRGMIQAGAIGFGAAARLTRPPAPAVSQTQHFLSGRRATQLASSRKGLAVAPRRGVVGKSWKGLIKGKAHASGPHRFRTYREAITMAKSGQYERIFLDRQLRTATGGRVKSLMRPDIVGMLRNGKVNMVEVVSSRQTYMSQWLKIQRMETMLGEIAGPGGSKVVIPH